MVSSRTNATVVLIHGWGGRALVMSYLGWCLRAAGFSTCSISYPGMRRTVEENAEYLHERVQRIQAAPVHYVAHSLGGIVLLEMLRRYNPDSESRVVLLAVPVQGSSLTGRARRSVLGQLLLRNLAESGDPAPLKIRPLPEIINRQSIGVLAGTNGFSLTGRLYGGTTHGDGVVELSETQLEGTVRRELSCSHTRMIFSRRCADETVRFLRTGRFSEENVTMEAC